MSTRLQGRALPLPVVWGREKVREATPPGVSDPPPVADEELMDRLKTNDASALHLLFYRYSRLVLGIALRILRDYGEAEEIVQDTYCYLYQKALLFDSTKGTAKGWIVQVAYHRALDRRAHLERRGFYLGTNGQSLGDTLLGETDLEREIRSRLNCAHLEKAFEELPERQRQTLELFYFEGLNLRDISEKLNEPLANIRHHYYRGLEKLRKSAFVQKLREK